ncbi:RsmB/NOP family class I SAM-dependent RNA methyltransferase [Singulisphaera sp. PoT]|uniref:RsmB/NOP family class I SAM-dependent RNA methyltransferase n=1 Tax=Singulisphaera sp. PoT TaxID=3411797 RepID=UPI003BF475BD
MQAESRDRAPMHVASVDLLAQTAVGLLVKVEKAVFQEGKRADRVLSGLLRTRRELAPPDLQFLTQAVFAVFRWHGWLEPANTAPPEARLLLAWLLDSPSIHPVCRVWARVLGRDLTRLNSLGDAPGWTARAEGLKRWFDGRAINADPWRLFPAWFRDHLPLPPGGASPKAKYLELLLKLQSRASLWIRAQSENEKNTWTELTEMGHKPWLHRHVTRAAKIDPGADVHHLPPFERGEIEIQDLASQAVAMACDPDPGERWWDACAGAGGKAIHLSALMQGKGLVVATDVNSIRLKEAVRRARRSPFRNLTTKEWDGKHLPAKAKSFSGVLVDAPCSGIGTWRRNPDARWSFEEEAILRLVELQKQLLHTCSGGVRPGGTLVYSVCTLTPSETTGVVRHFLETHPDFKLDPFPHPLDGTPTEGTLLIWPQEADTDAMFIARMVKIDTPKPAKPKSPEVAE